MQERTFGAEHKIIQNARDNQAFDQRSGKCTAIIDQFSELISEDVQSRANALFDNTLTKEDSENEVVVNGNLVTFCD